MSAAAAGQYPGRAHPPCLAKVALEAEPAASGATVTVAAACIAKEQERNETAAKLQLPTAILFGSSPNAALNDGKQPCPNLNSLAVGVSMSLVLLLTK
jgi:hypothetical protein